MWSYSHFITKCSSHDLRSSSPFKDLFWPKKFNIFKIFKNSKIFQFFWKISKIFKIFQNVHFFSNSILFQIFKIFDIWKNIYKNVKNSKLRKKNGNFLFNFGKVSKFWDFLEFWKYWTFWSENGLKRWALPQIMKTAICDKIWV